MLKENYRRVIYVDSPLDCPWRLGECGRHGCGNYSDCDYVYARHHPCEDEGVFPEDCPLDKVDKTKASKKVMTMKTEKQVKQKIRNLEKRLKNPDKSMKDLLNSGPQIEILKWVLEGADDNHE